MCDRAERVSEVAIHRKMRYVQDALESLPEVTSVDGYQEIDVYSTPARWTGEHTCILARSARAKGERERCRRVQSSVERLRLELKVPQGQDRVKSVEVDGISLSRCPGQHPPKVC